MGKLSTALSLVGDTPPGMIETFAGSSTIAGWLVCDGSVISQTTYARLFAVIGAAYDTGGEGAGNFRLPDLRGQFVRGHDPDGVVDGPGRVVGSPQGDQLGSHLHTVGTLSISSSPAPDVDHAHPSTTIAGYSEPGAHNHNQRVTAFTGSGSAPRRDYNADGWSNNVDNPDYSPSGADSAPHTHTLNVPSVNAPHSHPSPQMSGSSASEGGTQNSSETRPRNVCLVFMIKT